MRKIYYNEAIVEKEEIDAVCEFIQTKSKRLAYGEEVLKTERKLADFLGVKHCLLVNSGSSANLLAFMALTSHTLKTPIKKGDEIITTALGFPTTISPIIQYGAVPVFVDVDLQSANIDVSQLENALSPKTKAVMVAHTLGNPFDLDTVAKFCNEHSLYLIEDNCDGLGSLYFGRYTGTFGDIGTSSFYPAHHITCGEGGAVYTNNDEFYNIMRSMRDWGRDYKCAECQWDCKNRFASGHDCRYTYSHFGYNLKVTELQAVILNKQIDRLPLIKKIREYNRYELFRKLQKYEFIEFQTTVQTWVSNIPSWFSFLIRITDKAIDRNDFMQYLEKNGIGTRVLFGGNLIKQKMFVENTPEHRVVNDLKNTDELAANSFFIGCHPGMDDEDIDYIDEIIGKYVWK